LLVQSHDPHSDSLNKFLPLGLTEVIGRSAFTFPKHAREPCAISYHPRF
jgi:hypothetical protein